MIYYALESVVVGIFIAFVWNIFLRQFLGNIGYFQIVGIYWIIKMLFFNVFNLITGLAVMPKENDDYDPDNMNYNETITE